VLFAEQCAPARREEKKGREGKEKEKKTHKKFATATPLCSQTATQGVALAQPVARSPSMSTPYLPCREGLQPPGWAVFDPPPPSQCPVACIPTYLHTYIHSHTRPTAQSLGNAVLIPSGSDPPARRRMRLMWLLLGRKVDCTT